MCVFVYFCMMYIYFHIWFGPVCVYVCVFVIFFCPPGSTVVEPTLREQPGSSGPDGVRGATDAENEIIQDNRAGATAELGGFYCVFKQIFSKHWLLETQYKFSTKDIRDVSLSGNPLFSVVLS